MRVGGRSLNKFGSVEHTVPMLSLANAMNVDELVNFDSQVRRLLGRENIELKVIGEEGGGFLPSFSHVSALSCITIAALCSLYFQRRKLD